VFKPANPIRARSVAVARVAGVLAVAVWVVACEQPSKPRSYEFFMEDGLAREGVLARCNQDRKVSVDDQECANARRAAAALAANGEHERAQGYERESERKLAALRDRSARQQQAEEQAAAAAKAAESEAYESQWRGKKAPSADVPAAGGDPISDASDRDDGRESLSQLPARPELKIAAIAPPQGDVTPQKPEIEQAAIIPRPFRDSTLQR
jgi:hypothetical protein